MPKELSPLPPKSLLQEALLFLWEISKIIFISLAIIIPIRYFLIQPFYVKGASMEPNFHDHEYLIIDQITYRWNRPERGEVVVFRYPRNPKEFFIKRIIGLPGEQVKISDRGIIIVNASQPAGFELHESYLPQGYEHLGNMTVELKKDEYFLMGDNRDESLDSRVFGPVRSDHIVGRVFFRGWPFSKIQIYLNPPSYASNQTR